MFQFPGLSRAALWVQAGVAGYGPCRVAPFGDPGIEGCLLLPRDYRSLPRPSSTSCAKASAVRPWYLHLPSKVRTEKHGICFSRYFELMFKHTFAIVLSVHDADHLLNASALGLWFRIMVRDTFVPRAMQLSRCAGRSPEGRMLRTGPGDDLREIGLKVFRERGADARPASDSVESP